MRCQSYAVICVALLIAAAATQVVAQPARYLEQRQDHFDGGNANTWLQAYISYPKIHTIYSFSFSFFNSYYVNDSQWLPGSRAPVFLCIGGEGPPLDGSVVTYLLTRLRIVTIHVPSMTHYIRFLATGYIISSLQRRRGVAA